MGVENLGLELAGPRRPRSRLTEVRRLLGGDIGAAVVLATTVAALLHVAWVMSMASVGGDLAAQSFWAEAVRLDPGSAYNFAWYGGMHVPSYSLGSPYLMAWLGVRTTLVIAGTMTAGLTALAIACSGAVRRPWVPSLVAAVGMAGNAVSGRATFAVGLVFAAAAVCVVVYWLRDASAGRPARRALLITLAAVCSALATIGSPVAGLFIGLVAAGLWLAADDLPTGVPVRRRVGIVARGLFAPRRMASYALGVPPIAVVVLTSVLFPFSGREPMVRVSAILAIVTGIVLWLVAPLAWRTVRATALVYILAVVALWVIPSEVGSNITRFALIIGAVTLVAAWCSGSARNPLAGLRGLPRRHPQAFRRAVLGLVVAGSLAWQCAVATTDAVYSRPVRISDATAVVAALDARQANLGRLEIVPSRSHAEAAVLARYFTLARGWNRQADLERNPLFYDEDTPLTPTAYETWLHRWAVSYVVLPPGPTDPSSQNEATLVEGGLPYLTEVWSDHGWRVYRVQNPTPLVAAPGHLLKLTEASLRIHVDRPGVVRIRILYSPWLGVRDPEGGVYPAPRARPGDPRTINRHGCVEPDPEPGVIDGVGPEADVWTILRVRHPGDYTLAAPYSDSRGTPCHPSQAATSDGALGRPWHHGRSTLFDSRAGAG